MAADQRAEDSSVDVQLSRVVVFYRRLMGKPRELEQQKTLFG